MLNELSCWEVNWNAISAVATAVGTVVALCVAVFPSWIARRKTRYLARALFGYDVTGVLLTAHQLESPNAMKRLQTGEWPSEKQKKTLLMPHVKAHMGTLGLGSSMAAELAQLLNQCDQLSWRIENLEKPDIDYENGTCADAERNRTVNRVLLMHQAEQAHKVASSVQAKLHRRVWWRRWCQKSFGFLHPLRHP